MGSDEFGAEAAAPRESRIVHEEGRVVRAASTVNDDRGKTVALGDATLMIVEGDGASKKS